MKDKNNVKGKVANIWIGVPKMTDFWFNQTLLSKEPS